MPSVVGSSLVAAKQRLLQQPLETAVVYEPAKPGQRMGIVVAQFPAGGTLSSWQKVTVVLPKSLHGVVPLVVGRTVTAGRRARLAKLKLRVRINGPAHREGRLAEPGGRNGGGGRPHGRAANPRLR